MATKKKIEMRGILPRYPEDHTAFLVEKLAEIEPCTIAELVRHLGGEPRVDAAPSAEYTVVQQALKAAQKEGKVDVGLKRGSWRVKR